MPLINAPELSLVQPYHTVSWVHVNVTESRGPLARIAWLAESGRDDQ